MDGSGVFAGGGGADIGAAMSAGVPGGTIRSSENNAWVGPTTKESRRSVARSSDPRFDLATPSRNVESGWGQDELHFQGDYFFCKFLLLSNVPLLFGCQIFSDRSLMPTDHHTDADNVIILDPAQMDRTVAIWGTYAYAIASLPVKMPRGAALTQADVDGVWGSPHAPTQPALPPVVPTDVINAIDAARPEVARIIHESVDGAMQGEAWSRLAQFTDTIGNRLAGSASFELGVDYLMDFFAAEGFARGASAAGDRVYTEAAMVPHWVRGEEWAKLKQPLIGDREWDLNMLGLGGSVGTIGQATAGASGSIEAEVVVFGSVEEMQANPADVAGRIVLIKEFWAGYRTGARTNSNIEAEKLGAVATMIRSVGPFSLDSPHTGATGTPAGQVVSAIPTIALTVENAEMISRMFARCPSAAGCMRIELYMEATYNQPGTTTQCLSDECAPSRNTIVDVVGSQYPDEIVLLSGHLDSWDVGFGAMDDGGGVFISLQVCSMLKRLNIRPLRTVRCVGWTSEEMGSQGSRRYWSDHAGDLSDFSAVFESDGGVFDTTGIGFSASLEAHAIVRRIGTLLAGIDGASVGPRGGGADISGAMRAGVPGGTIQTEANSVFTNPTTRGPDTNVAEWGQDELHFQGNYFYYHHTDADNVIILDPAQMDRTVAIWATHAYVIASLPSKLPRGPIASAGQLESAFPVAFEGAVAGSLIDQGSQPTESPLGLATPYADQVIAALDAITPETLLEYDTRLVSFYTRLTLSANTPVHNQGIIPAREYIRDTLRSFSPLLQVDLDCYDVAAHGRVISDVEMCNVVGILPGRSDRRIYVSGHYDSVARQLDGTFDWSRTDTPAPGANDDGSGTVLMMTVARALVDAAAAGGGTAYSPFFDATLVFVAHVAEEEGLEGAALHARQAVEQGWRIDAIFNNDIIGNSRGGGGAEDGSSLRIFSQDSTDSGSRQLARYIRDLASKFVPDHAVRLIAREDRFGRGGDHTPYNREGFTAVRITESKENYSRQHTVDDTLDGLDFEYLAKNARVNLAGMFSLAAAPAAPGVQGTNGPMLTRGNVPHGSPEEATSLGLYDAVLSWEAVSGAEKYRIVWRDGWALDWSHSMLVAADPSVSVQSHTLLSISIDDFIFGVAAVGPGGFESLVSPYVRPPRRDAAVPTVDSSDDGSAQLIMALESQLATLQTALAARSDAAADEPPGAVLAPEEAAEGAAGMAGVSYAGIVFALVLGLAVGGMVGFGARRKGWDGGGGGAANGAGRKSEYAGLTTKDMEDGQASD